MTQKIDQAGMSLMLESLAESFSEHVEAFPGVAALCAVALKVAEDPSVIPTSLAVKAKTKAAPKPKKQKTPIAISYTGEEILVGGLTKAGVNFWKVKFALDKIQGIDTGRKVDKPGTDYHGQAVYKSTYDKKTKGNRLPIACKAAVLAWFKGEGIAVNES